MLFSARRQRHMWLYCKDAWSVVFMEPNRCSNPYLQIDHRWYCSILLVHYYYCCYKKSVNNGCVRDWQVRIVWRSIAVTVHPTPVRHPGDGETTLFLLYIWWHTRGVVSNPADPLTAKFLSLWSSSSVPVPDIRRNMEIQSDRREYNEGSSYCQWHIYTY